MAKIVDKKQKRKEIALSCKDILLNKGFKNITVSELAKAANIGKGTIYEYFENKEDIVFEIIKIYIEEYNKTLLKKINSVDDILEKLLIFFEFFYKESDEIKFYKEFLAISLISPTQRMKEFKGEVRKIYLDILSKIVDKDIADIFYNAVIGKFIEKETTLNKVDLKEFIIEMYEVLKDKK